MHALAVALSLGAAVASAQQDALVVERNAVTVSTDLAVAGTATANRFSGMGAMPVGAILMWSGAVDQLPAGWALCDGRTLPDGGKSPDLSGRFIVGYDGKNVEYSANKTGGEARHALSIDEMPKHSHEATTDISGEHTHTLNVSKEGWAYKNWFLSGDPNTRSEKWTQQLPPAGQHGHRVTIKDTGSGRPFDNRPPYYVLAYIMYTGK